MGMACDDPDFLYHATDYVRTLIRQSEPTTSRAIRPEPSLTYVEGRDPSPEEIAEWEFARAEARVEEEEVDCDDDGNT